jgi:hypothetical protein
LTGLPIIHIFVGTRDPTRYPVRATPIRPDSRPPFPLLFCSHEANSQTLQTLGRVWLDAFMHLLGPGGGMQLRMIGIFYFLTLFNLKFKINPLPN